MEHLCRVRDTPVVIVQDQIDSGARSNEHDTVWHCVAVWATAGRQMYPKTLKRLSKLNHFIRAAFLT